MTISQLINQRIIEEYKSGNNQVRILLQTVKSELLSKAKDLKRELSAEEEAALMRKEVKQRQEALRLYEEGGRNDLVDKMKKEIEILSSYLPVEMTDEQLEQKIRQIYSDSQDKSFGMVMKQAMQQLREEADGSRIAAIVKKLTEN